MREQVPLRQHLYVIFGFMGLVWLLDRIEYQRRLAELNHAHQQAVDERNTFLKKDSYDQDQKAQREALAIAAQRSGRDIHDLQSGAVGQSASQAGGDRIQRLIIAATAAVVGVVALAFTLVQLVK